MKANRNYHTVAFDLDGTLTDPYRGLSSAFRYAFRKMGIDYGGEEVLKSFIGPPIRELWQQLYSITKEQSEKTVEYFREYFSVYGWWDNVPYSGIHTLLAELKRAGKRIVLATSKPDVYSSKILERFSLSEYFDFSEGASFDTSREKKADVLKYALDSIGLNEADYDGVILVGDTKFDIIGANEIGVDSVGVLWGYGEEEELRSLGASYIAENMDALGKILLPQNHTEK